MPQHNFENLIKKVIIKDFKLSHIKNSKKLKTIGDPTKYQVQKCNRNQYQGHRPVEIDPLPIISTFPKGIFFSRKGQSILIVGIDVSPCQSDPDSRPLSRGSPTMATFEGNFFCPSFPTSFFTCGAKRWVGNPRGRELLFLMAFLRGH